MPRGEDVEIAEPKIFLPALVTLFLVAPLAPTFLLFFTRLPSSFENLGAANRQQNTSYPLSTPPPVSPPLVQTDARIGTTGVDEYFLDPIPLSGTTTQAYRATFTAQRGGELFLHVNDAVIGLPWANDHYFTAPNVAPC